MFEWDFGVSAEVRGPQAQTRHAGRWRSACTRAQAARRPAAGRRRLPVHHSARPSSVAPVLTPASLPRQPQRRCRGGRRHRRHRRRRRHRSMQGEGMGIWRGGSLSGAHGCRPRCGIGQTCSAHLPQRRGPLSTSTSARPPSAWPHTCSRGFVASDAGHSMRTRRGRERRRDSRSKVTQLAVGRNHLESSISASVAHDIGRASISNQHSCGWPDSGHVLLRERCGIT